MPSVTLVRYFYIWKFSVTWSHNSTRISSHILGNGPQHIGVTTSTCLSRDGSLHVTIWRHRSRDYLIPQVPFPKGALLQPSLDL